MLRMQGGVRYGPDHPFVQALDRGADALQNFYAHVQPQSITDLYGLAGDQRRGADLPPWELPWYLRLARRAPPGELSLDATHGVSFFGPCSDRKVELELLRLRRLRDSILRHGYDPDGHGDIEGYILRDGDAACFFIRGGKHRAAVLTKLGFDWIPVSFRAGFPRMIDTEQARIWPLVRTGAMDIGLARDILRAYTRRPPRGGKMDNWE
jgi:hypothetical protein